MTFDRDLLGTSFHFGILDKICSFKLVLLVLHHFLARQRSLALDVILFFYAQDDMSLIASFSSYYISAIFKNEFFIKRTLKLYKPFWYLFNIIQSTLFAIMSFLITASVFAFDNRTDTYLQFYFSLFCFFRYISYCPGCRQ